MRFASLVLMTLLVSTAAGAQDGVRRDPLRTISVTGAADVKVMPDQVVMTLGIWSRASRLEEAKSDNETRTRKVLAFLRGAGLRSEQIRTDFLAIHPNLEWGSTERRYTYDVLRNVVVTLDDTRQFEGTLNGAIANGVDNVVSVRFLTTKLREYRNQARALAVRAARAKAEKMCAELGVTAGAVQSIEEEPSYDNWNWWSSYWWGGSSRGASQVQVSVPAEGGRGDGYDTLALGAIPVSASVRVTFLVR